jgi:hypothetical protein
MDDESLTRTSVFPRRERCPANHVGTAIVFVLPFLTGCAGTEAALRQQAAADLQCSQVQIRFAEEPDHIRRGVVSGCDLEIGYLSTWWGPWKMDSRGHLK